MASVDGEYKRIFGWETDAAGDDYKEFLTLEEGLCVQCLHVGPYDTEPATVEQMHAFAAEQGYELDFSDVRRHHEIYLSDPRKTAPEKWKTVIRHPVKKL